MPPDWVRRPLAWLTAAGRRLPEPVKARLRLVAAAVRAYRAYRPPATPASSPDARVVPAGWDAAFTGPGHLNPKVSVLIVTWNNVALTRQCLDSLLADTHAPDFEIVLVDNASQDETRAYLQQLAVAHPTRVKLRLNDTNAGFARANNQALALAQGDDIVFLNNDTVVTRGWLGRLTHYLSNPQVGLVGPVTNGAGNEARIEPGYDTLAGLPGFAERCTRARAGLAFDIPVLALYCLAARRAVLEQLGPLDERFGQGLFEDDDLALRARRAGYRVLCAEDVYVHHWQRAGFKLLAQAEYDTLFAHNRRLFEAKWGRPWQPHAYRDPLAEPPPPAAFDPNVIVWRCNICGQPNQTPLDGLTREAQSCPACLSTVRLRGVIHLLSLALFGESLPLADFPARRDLRGLGLSDWEGYAEPLGRKLDYTNTWYHQPPRLDIAAIDPALAGTLDFLIASDVFEHVAPPVSRAFANARRLLKPGGVMVFSVPFELAGENIEHFPELHDYQLITQQGQPVLRNVTPEGREQLFHELRFHGGVGATLETRVFSQAGLRACLAEAGFSDVRFHGEPHFAHGVYWEHAWSLPLVARAA